MIRLRTPRASVRAPRLADVRRTPAHPAPDPPAPRHRRPGPWWMLTILPIALLLPLALPPTSAADRAATPRMYLSAFHRILPSDGIASETLQAVVPHPSLGAVVTFSGAGRGCGTLAAHVVPVGLDWGSINRTRGGIPTFTKVLMAPQAQVQYTAGIQTGPCLISARESPDGLTASLTLTSEHAPRHRWPYPLCTDATLALQINPGPTGWAWAILPTHGQCEVDALPSFFAVMPSGELTALRTYQGSPVNAYSLSLVGSRLTTNGLQGTSIINTEHDGLCARSIALAVWYPSLSRPLVSRRVAIPVCRGGTNVVVYLL